MKNLKRIWGIAIAVAYFGIAMPAIAESGWRGTGDRVQIVQVEIRGEEDAIAELPDGVVDRVLEAVAEQTDRARSQFNIVAAQKRTWPDGCLGLTQPGVLCTQALVPGWEVTVSNGEDTWVYRTDEEGSVVKLDTAQSSAYELTEP